MDDDDKVAEKYRMLNDLWMSENSVKTNKLQVLLATNAILVSAMSLAEQPIIWIAIAGCVFSTVWVFSLGRTVEYQKHWSEQMKKIEEDNKDNLIFTIHSTRPKTKIWGRISSNKYLIGTPIGTAIAWFGVIIYTLLT